MIMPENVPIDVVRVAIKEAVAEWLDARFIAFGKWTFRGIAADSSGVWQVGP
jgi:hypothetical protein